MEVQNGAEEATQPTSPVSCQGFFRNRPRGQEGSPCQGQDSFWGPFVPQDAMLRAHPAEPGPSLGVPRGPVGRGGLQHPMARLHGLVQPPLGCVTLAQYHQGRKPLFYEWTVIAMTT